MKKKYKEFDEKSDAGKIHFSCGLTVASSSEY